MISTNGIVSKAGYLREVDLEVTEKYVIENTQNTNYKLQSFPTL
jgi:hypothetical protein